MINSYKTLSSPAEAEVVEKRSRFIAQVKPVSTPEEAAEFIAEICKKHHAARHNVYAYRLLSGKEKYSDDAEPQGTAGMPILEVLRGEGLTDCVVVVTRYFGGILLGMGGLQRAYTAAAVEGIAKAKPVQMDLYGVYSLSLDYNRYGKLPSMISSLGGKITETVFEDAVKVEFLLPDGTEQSFADALTEFSGGTLSATPHGTKFCMAKE